VQEGAYLIATDECTISDLVVLPVLEPPFTSAALNTSFTTICDGMGGVGGKEVEVEWIVHGPISRTEWTDDEQTPHTHTKRLGSTPHGPVVLNVCSTRI